VLRLARLCAEIVLSRPKASAAAEAEEDEAGVMP
jgi:hypothetical protein